MYKFGIYFLSFLLSYNCGSSLAEIDRAKEAQQIVEAMKGANASLWLMTTNIYQPIAVGRTKISALSRAVFEDLAEKGNVSISYGKWNQMQVILLPPVAEIVDNTFPEQREKESTYIYFMLGTYDEISILDISKVNNKLNCEWNVTYRGWINKPTIIGEAVAKITGIDGEKDGFKFQICFKVGRKALEPVFQNFEYPELE